MIKVGINGFGRIGRFVFRAAQDRHAIPESEEAQAIPPPRRHRAADRTPKDRPQDAGQLPVGKCVLNRQCHARGHGMEPKKADEGASPSSFVSNPHLGRQHGRTAFYLQTTNLGVGEYFLRNDYVFHSAPFSLTGGKSALKFFLANHLFTTSP